MSSNIWLNVLIIYGIAVLISYIFYTLTVLIEEHQLKEAALLSLIPLWGMLLFIFYKGSYKISKALAKTIGKHRLGKPVLTTLEWQVVSLFPNRDFRLGFKLYWKTILANPKKVAEAIKANREKLDETKDWED